MCRAESPAVEQFARDHTNKLRIVGLGTQDDLAYAEDFVADGGITFTMLWDDSFESWRGLGVRGQPAAMLFAADGKLLGRWTGPFDEDEVLRLVGG